MNHTLKTFVPLTFRRRGARRVAADDCHVHDVTLLEGVARSFYWQHLVDTGVMKSGSDIARARRASSLGAQRADATDPARARQPRPADDRTAAAPDEPDLVPAQPAAGGLGGAAADPEAL